MMATTAYLSVLKSRIQRGDLEQAEKQLSNISDSIGMLGATLDHLLTAARYDSGTEPINVESVELKPLLERLHATFADEAASKGIELRVRYPSGRVVVSTDAMALWRVLMNLVSNAIKFTETNSVSGRGVLVRCALRNRVCRIDVADTGMGISAEFQNAIWQPYFQVANAERNRAHGLGLGLFLVRRAVDHLPDHHLAMRSRLGRGSRFSVSLPGSRLSEADVGRTEPPPISDSDLGLISGAYVLVIEDDREARRAMCALLEDWSVVYSSGATLEEALIDTATSPRTIDLVVSDYRLPGSRNGVECILELRRLFGDEIPAVIVTGESDLAAIRAVMPADTTLLQKPFDPPELLAPLRAAVLRARARELE
jgi:CheY-like chemotaxis protein